MRFTGVLAALTVAALAPNGLALDYCRSYCDGPVNKFFQYNAFVTGIGYVFDDK
jgi:hypothetical protein